MAAAIRGLTVSPDSSRMIRSVMLTPWFAVSAGIVVAASLTLVSPHAALTFPPSHGGRCTVPGCHPGRSRSAGQPSTTSRREIKLHVSEKRYIRARPSPIKVSYQLLPRRNGRFMAVIVLSDDKPLGKWNLRFVLPGGRIDSVMWARWQPDGPGGIDVQGAPLPWPRSGANEARIVLLGTGAPRWPGQCVIDDARCLFRALST